MTGRFNSPEIMDGWLFELPKATVFTRGAGLILVFVSILLPVITVAHNAKAADWEPGYIILIFGPLGMLVGQFAWLGNIMLPVSILSRRRWPSVVTLICAISAVDWKTQPADSGAMPIAGYGWGYYLWIAGMFIGSLPLILPYRTNVRF